MSKYIPDQDGSDEYDEYDEDDWEEGYGESSFASEMATENDDAHVRVGPTKRRMRRSLMPCCF